MATRSSGVDTDADWEPVEVPVHLLSKLDGFIEYRMGVKRVAVVLSDGRVFKPAFVSGRSVRRVGPPDEPFHRIPFRTEEVADLLDDCSD